MIQFYVQLCERYLLMAFLNIYNELWLTKKKNDQKHSITNNLCSDIAISFDEKIYASKDTDIEGYRTEHIIQLKVEHAHNDKQKKQKSLGNAT